jgi:hypothetical protein
MTERTGAQEKTGESHWRSRAQNVGVFVLDPVAAQRFAVGNKINANLYFINMKAIDDQTNNND